MLSRLSPLLLRTLHPPFPADAMAARALSRAPLSPPNAACSFRSSPSHSSILLPSSARVCVSPLCLDPSVFGLRLNALRFEDRSIPRGFRNVLATSERGYRKVRRRRPAAKSKEKEKEKELELSVDICIEEQLPDDSEILDVS